MVGSEYQAIAPEEKGWRWSQELSLYLGIWEGRLRYFNQDAELIPTPEEAALQEHQRAETEHQRAEEAEAKAAILTERLRELGIDPDNLP
ncbi:hypothetical protein H6G81_09970 [Scytonema hofmannii FACHB-248]|uniref:Uma2 family endonuclease n=1 Tax=Scytonema hofmannii FACHB-248 TaxID=1842502 RepID=A0ABR8GQ23_9CYAN|nr:MULTISPECIES: hypothetical protein [Nostocales]MBD2604843.1 hypothetical protein [Scytonema hofmannii FACHB-248]